MATAGVRRQAGRCVLAAVRHRRFWPVQDPWPHHSQTCGRGVSRLHVVGHGAREAIEVFRRHRRRRWPGAHLEGLRAHARWTCGQQCRCIRRRLDRGDRAADAWKVVPGFRRKGGRPVRSSSGRPAAMASCRSPAPNFPATTASRLPWTDASSMSCPPDCRRSWRSRTAIQRGSCAARGPCRSRRTMFTGGRMGGCSPPAWPMTSRNAAAHRDRSTTCRGWRPARAAPSRQPSMRARFQHEVIVETPAVAVFSNATMVLPMGQQFWLGTFSGDRIAHGALRH